MKKTGGTLDWLGCRAFGVEELRAEPGRQGRKEMYDNCVLKSLNYNNQTGLRASRGDFLPTARCGPLRLVPRRPAGAEAMRCEKIVGIKALRVKTSWQDTVALKPHEAKKACRTDICWRKTDYSNSVEFPAVGHRDNYSDGSLHDVGTWGRYWSSVANGSGLAYGLYFDSSAVYVYIGSSKQYGLSVRCVR